MSEWARELGAEVGAGRAEDGLPLIGGRRVTARLCQVPLDPDGPLCLRLFWATGLRAEELGSLEWAGGGLGLAGGRRVAVDGVTREQLRQRLGERPPGEVLGEWADRLEGWLREAARSVGLAARFEGCGRPLTLQLFRHSFAVRCLEGGMDLLVLSQLLGHQDLATTQNYLPMAMGACRKAYLECHPLVVGRRPQSHISVEEALALIDSPSRERDRLMLRLLYATGLRASELLGLYATDIDAEEGVLFVRGGKDGQDRYALVDPESLQRLLVYAGQRGLDRRLFRTTRAQLHILVKRAARAVGVLEKYEALGQVVSPHTFRHACASHCYQAGMSPDLVRKLLGHEDLRNTLLYVDCPEGRLVREYERCHPWVRS